MQPSEDPMIRLRGLGKTYPDGTVAVQELDLDVPRGSVVCLVGPSGCGKSTTLKMVNRLIEPTSGTITIAGRDAGQVDPVEMRRHIGYVIQQIGLFPHQTIRTNVATVPSLLGWDKRRTNERADELMSLVGLEPSVYGDRYPDQLSGGQRQRVGVARALAADPPVLLMDEPFGAVDPINREKLQDEFLRLQRELHKTVMLVTHDIEEAVKLGDRVAVFAPGGRLVQYDAAGAGPGPAGGRLRGGVRGGLSWPAAPGRHADQAGGPGALVRRGRARQRRGRHLRDAGGRACTHDASGPGRRAGDLGRTDDRDPHAHVRPRRAPPVRHGGRASRRLG